MRKKIFILFISICCVLTGSAQTSQAIRQLLSSPFMRGASFSLVVKELNSGKIVYSHEPDLQVAPASVLKTVATATALEMLGEDYRYPTSIEYEGTLENGILKGNLYIKGSGDPSLGSSYFASEQNTFMRKWIDAIQKAGIREVKGAVIADESIFDTEGVSIRWLREDMGNYYAPGSYGLSIFDNMYKLYLQSGAPGSRVTIKRTEPDVSFIHFSNYLKSAPAALDSAYIVGAPYANERYLYGAIPANRENHVLKGDIPEPALFLAQYLTKKMKAAGITVHKAPTCYRIEKEAGRWNTNKRHTLVTTYSPELKEIAKVTNHVSHNLFADALVKTVGLQYKPGQNEVISSFGRGIKAVTGYWKSKGLDVFPLWMNDGSGLAPFDKVSARFINDLLTYMALHSKYSDAFITSLPQAGIEGSVRNFLKDTKLQGKARLKSGGISRVRSYAGYVEIDGKTYAVAVFSNNYSCNMATMTRMLEKLLVNLF